MLDIKGAKTSARIFTDVLEEKALEQIKELCNQPFMKDVKVRVMPDVHAGAGCTIGTTMVLNEAVAPSLVGVDIGCGVEAYRFQARKPDLARLDDTIYSMVPSGFKIRKNPHDLVKQKVRPLLDKLRCSTHADLQRAELSIGTLGGGNHFIEVNSADDGSFYLVIHTGSRHLGTEVAGYYQDVAYKAITGRRQEKYAAIDELKASGREREIEKYLQEMNQHEIRKALAPLMGQDYLDYIHDMEITQAYAAYNRQAIAAILLNAMGWEPLSTVKSVHNYIDTSSGILRKGAISARKDEMLIIPINMADGSLIGRGKGNPDWNYSAPHGAGRLMSRQKAKACITLDQMKGKMKGIYTTSCNKGTLDEAPQAYKPVESILANIVDSVEVFEQIHPIYNFKAAG